MKRSIRKRRAISPVITTVILVAVAITVAVAVSYWMSGFAGQYTQFEKVEIKTAVCTGDASAGWTIIIKLKNTGSATATLTNVFVNDAEATVSATGPTPDAITTNMSATTQIESGQETPGTVWIGAGYKELSSGTTVNIKIHSAGGMDYIKLIELT